jgi:hypothetical protein
VHVPSVLKTCVFELKAEATQFIYETVSADIMRLAKHKFGCATLQRCLEAGTAPQTMLLANAISVHARELAVDGHGNYILQFVVDMPLMKPKQALVEALKGS